MRHRDSRTPAAAPALGLALAVALLAAAATAPAAAATVKVAVQADPDFPVAERVAVLRTGDDGAQTLTLQTISRFFLKEVSAGERLGPDATIDLAALWGTGLRGRTAFVDVLISSTVKPGSVFLLDANLHLVELQGIWGTGNVGIWGTGNVGIWGTGNVGIWGTGNVGIWGTGNVGILHGPLWEPGACGPATTLAEGVRHVADPEAVIADPFLAIGTAGGCVGLAGIPEPHHWFPGSEWVPDPNEWFEDFPNPDEWLTAPIEATGDPLIDVAGAGGRGAPVTDLVTIPVTAKLRPRIGTWIPEPDQWLPPSRDWFPDPNSWFPDPNAWIPNPDNWYDVGALVGGRVAVLHPGTRGAGGHLGTPPYRATDLIGAAEAPPLVALAGDGQKALAWPPQVAPDAELASIPLVGADGTLTLRRAELGGALVWGTETELPATGTLEVPADAWPARGATGVELGSLWAIGDDGSVLFAFEYEAGDATLGELVPLGGIAGVDLGPRAFQLSAQGNFVTGVIEAGGDSMLDVDAASVTLSIAGDELEPLAPLHSTVADEDNDLDLELVVKFSRAEVADRLAARGQDSATLVLGWSYLEVCDDEGNPCRGGYAQQVKILP